MFVAVFNVNNYLIYLKFNGNDSFIFSKTPTHSGCVLKVKDECYCY